MPQTSITSFFNSRKRPASEDIVGSKSKIAHIEKNIGTGSRPIRKAIVQKCNIKDVRNSFAVPNGIKLNGLKNIVTAHDCTAQTCPSKNVPEQKDVKVFAKKQNTSNISNNTELPNVNSARKELSLGDIRKKLSGSSRLAELRATAERLSKGIQDLKEASDKKNLREFKSIHVEVPSRLVLLPNVVIEELAATTAGATKIACVVDANKTRPIHALVALTKFWRFHAYFSIYIYIRSTSCLRLLTENDNLLGVNTELFDTANVN